MFAGNLGATPTASPSSMRSATVQEIEHVVLDVVGPDAVTGLRPGWWSSYFRSRPASVYGGTEQIQRNIVAQRLLGMPRAR